MALIQIGILEYLLYKANTEYLTAWKTGKFGHSDTECLKDRNEICLSNKTKLILRLIPFFFVCSS